MKNILFILLAIIVIACEKEDEQIIPEPIQPVINCSIIGIWQRESVDYINGDGWIKFTKGTFMSFNQETVKIGEFGGLVNEFQYQIKQDSLFIEGYKNFKFLYENCNTLILITDYKLKYSRI